MSLVPMDYAEDWLLARAALRRFEERATHEDWLRAAMELDTLAQHIEQLAKFVQSKGVTVA